MLGIKGSCTHRGACRGGTVGLVVHASEGVDKASGGGGVPHVDQILGEGHIVRAAWDGDGTICGAALPLLWVADPNHSPGDLSATMQRAMLSQPLVMRNTHLMLIRYWARVTASAGPVIVIRRSAFCSRSSDLLIRITAPEICLWTAQYRRLSPRTLRRFSLRSRSSKSRITLRNWALCRDRQKGVIKNFTYRY